MAGQTLIQVSFSVNDANPPRTVILSDQSSAMLREVSSRIWQNIQDIRSTPGPETVIVGVTTAADPLYATWHEVGWCKLKNLDDLHYVQLGWMVSSVFYPFMRLGPKDEALIRLDVLGGDMSKFAGLAELGTVKLLISMC